MQYKCNKCHYYTRVFSPHEKKESQIVKKGKRRNQCPRCGAYNNKKIEKKWIEKNQKWFNNGAFQEEKWIEY